jgi:hypothetical protein
MKNGIMKRVASKNLRNVKVKGGIVSSPIFIIGTIAPPNKAAIKTYTRASFLFFISYSSLLKREKMGNKIRRKSEVTTQLLSIPLKISVAMVAEK